MDYTDLLKAKDKIIAMQFAAIDALTKTTQELREEIADLQEEITNLQTDLEKTEDKMERFRNKRNAAGW